MARRPLIGEGSTAMQFRRAHRMLSTIAYGTIVGLCFGVVFGVSTGWVPGMIFGLLFGVLVFAPIFAPRMERRGIW